MIPKKTLIEAAEKDGSMARLNQLLSASQILLCEANNLVEEASDLMRERGLMLGAIKQLHTRFVQSADAYFKEFSSLVIEEQSKMDMFNDMDSFDAYFRKWAKIPKGWEPSKNYDEKTESLLRLGKNRECPQKAFPFCYVRERKTGLQKRQRTKGSENNPRYRDRAVSDRGGRKGRLEAEPYIHGIQLVH